MSDTYEGILKGNRISWTKGQPKQRDAIRVRVTVLEEAEERQSRGRRMESALRRLADRGGLTGVGDPEEWQRGVRADRSLPGRDA